MQDDYSEFFARPLKPGEVCGEQVGEQQRSDQISAGQNRNLPVGAGRRPENYQAMKVSRLHGVNAFMDLCERAKKNEYHSEPETEDCQPEGRKNT